MILSPEGTGTAIALFGQILKILLDLPLELGRATPLQGLHDLLTELLRSFILFLSRNFKIPGVDTHAALITRRAVGEWLLIEGKRIARPPEHHWHRNLAHLAALRHLLHSLLHGLLSL
jgi:hypothetical protein